MVQHHSRTQARPMKASPLNLVFCAACGSTMAKVSGKDGGYYGCLGATKGACNNRVLVRRSLVERAILAALRHQLSTPTNLDYVFERLGQEVAAALADVPEELRLREAEYVAEECRIGNLVEFIAQGRGSQAVADA